MPYSFSVPRPTVVRTLNATEQGLRDGGGQVKKMWVTNPDASDAGWFKAWDVLEADLVAASSRILFDVMIPAGGTLQIEDVPYELGFTARFTGATGATNTTAPTTAATIHDFVDA